jgi:hypothetical protein
MNEHLYRIEVINLFSEDYKDFKVYLNIKLIDLNLPTGQNFIKDSDSITLLIDDKEYLFKTGYNFDILGFDNKILRITIIDKLGFNIHFSNYICLSFTKINQDGDI